MITVQIVHVVLKKFCVCDFVMLRIIVHVGGLVTIKFVCYY